MSFFSSAPSAPGARSALAGAVWACVSSAVIAQAADEPVLSPVVVTAAREPQPISEVLANMTVVSRDEIERASGTSVADVLRTVPGFEMVRQGTGISNTNLFLRGAEKRHVLVLIDGVPFESQTTSGGPTWESLPLAQIERIEVLRGPASAIYGSAAVAGVVQIFTRKGQAAPQASIGLGIGTQDQGQADATFSGRWGAVDVSVGASAGHVIGPSARTNARANSRAADRDGSRDAAGHLSLGWSVAPGHRIQLGWVQSHANSQYDATTSSRNDDRIYRDLSNGNVAWSAQWSDSLSTRVIVGQSVDRYEAQPANSRNQTTTHTASTLTSWRLQQHVVRLVLDYRRDEFRNSSAPMSTLGGVWPSRDDRAIGLGHEWRSGIWSTNLNARQDDDSEFGRQHTGNIGAGVRLSPDWQVLGSWGTAFKAPTLYQRFSPYGVATLSPESSRTSELSLRYQSGVRRFGVTLYDTHIDHMIEYVSRPAAAGCSRAATEGCYMDVGTVHLKGAELSGAAPWLGVRWSGSLDFGVPKVVRTDALLDRRARQRATVRAESEMLGWKWGVQAQAQGYRTDAGNRLGGYTLWSADMSRALAPQWKVFARVDNLTDRHYELARNYAVAPRTFFVGVRWTPSL